MPVLTGRTRDPRTKEDLLNRMFSFDFSGDIRALGERPAILERTNANKALLTFPASNQTFELVIRKPRAFAKTSKSGETVGAAPKAAEEVEETPPRSTIQTRRKTPARKKRR